MQGVIAVPKSPPSQLMRSLSGWTAVPLAAGQGPATPAIDAHLVSPSSHDHGHDDHGHGHDHHGHGHDHGHHDHDLRDVSRKSLTISFVLITTYMVAEIVGGLLSGSLALLADAGHMATDAGAIAMALFAMWMANREASTERTYGYYRTEVLAAMLNALALWLIVGWIMYEAVERFGHHGGEIEGWSVLFVGLGGLIVNLITVWILHRSAEHSINAEGAFQHVLADLLGSVGVVVSAILVITLGWAIADPILSVVIGLLIMLSSWRTGDQGVPRAARGDARAHRRVQAVQRDRGSGGRHDHPRRPRLDDNLGILRVHGARAGGSRLR